MSDTEDKGVALFTVGQVERMQTQVKQLRQLVERNLKGTVQDEATTRLKMLDAELGTPVQL